MFEENQPVPASSQHRVRFLDRVRMIEPGEIDSTTSLQNVSNEIEVLFLLAYKQNSQRRTFQSGFGGCIH